MGPLPDDSGLVPSIAPNITCRPVTSGAKTWLDLCVDPGSSGCVAGSIDTGGVRLADQLVFTYVY